MAKYVIEDSTLTGIAGAIREKTGGTDAIAVSGMAAEISAIETGSGVEYEEIESAKAVFYYSLSRITSARLGMRYHQASKQGFFSIIDNVAYQYAGNYFYERPVKWIGGSVKYYSGSSEFTSPMFATNLHGFLINDPAETAISE